MIHNSPPWSHLVLLKDTSWLLWCDTALRSMELPAQNVLIPCNPEVATTADTTIQKAEANANQTALAQAICAALPLFVVSTTCQSHQTGRSTRTVFSDDLQKRR